MVVRDSAPSAWGKGAKGGPTARSTLPPPPATRLLLAFQHGVQQTMALVSMETPSRSPTSVCAAAGPGLGPGAGRALRRRRRSGEAAGCGGEAARVLRVAAGSPRVLAPRAAPPAAFLSRPIPGAGPRIVLEPLELHSAFPGLVLCTASHYASRPAGVWDCRWYGCAFA